MAAWLVVGLGNPGPTYASHRHNVGHMVVDEIVRRAGASWSAPRGLKALVCQTRLSTGGWGVPGVPAIRVALMKSRGYMNESGVPTAAVMRHIGGDVKHVIVVHDELDIGFATLRLKQGGGDNGHNGLKSIRAWLGSGDFFRVRCGIGRPPTRMDPADYVLSNFARAEQEDLRFMIGEAADAIESLLTDGLAAAQNKFNR